MQIEDIELLSQRQAKSSISLEGRVIARETEQKRSTGQVWVRPCCLFLAATYILDETFST